MSISQKDADSVNAVRSEAVKWEPAFKGSKTGHHRAGPQSSLVSRLIGFAEDYWPHAKVAAGQSDLRRKGNGLQFILEQLHNATGIKVGDLDPALVMRRVGWRMRVNGVDDLVAYKAILEDNPSELPALRKSLLIRVTDFFRDPNVYFAIEQTVLPVMLDEAGEHGLRVQIAGCSTGEEAYSIAMLIDLMLKKQRATVPVRVLAKDQDENALILARRGYYPHLVTADLSSFCLDQFFEATEDGYRINERIRSMVRFVPTQTGEATPASDLDLLICRNQLMFRDDKTQNELIDAFYGQLRPGGILVLEPTVSSAYLLKHFDEADQQHGLYKRKEAIQPSPSKDSAAARVEVGAPRAEKDRLLRYLEEELFQMRERLQLTIDEYEVAHDELVDLNHRLQVSLREVLLERDQVSAEYDGLKNVEAGVLSANKELKERNDQLKNAFDHLQHVISQSSIGLLYLGNEQQIKMFTPNMGGLFDLGRKDIGRPLADVTSPFHWDICADAAQVVRTQAPLEREERCSQDRWYRININPFSEGDKSDGVVCTFVDITEQKRASEWDRFKASVLNQMQDAVVVTNKDLRITYLNSAAKERYGSSKKSDAGGLLDELYRNMWKDGREKEKAHEALASVGHWSGEHFHITREGKEIKVHSSLSVLSDEAGEEIGMLTVVRTIEPRYEDRADSLRMLIADIEKRSDALDVLKHRS